MTRRTAARPPNEPRLRTARVGGRAPGGGFSLTSWFTRLAALSPLAAAAAYAIAYDVNRSALQVFGLRPEDLGWGRSTILVQAGALFLIITAMVLGYTFVAVAQYRLVRGTEPHARGAPPLGLAGWGWLGAVVVVPVALAFLIASVAPPGGGWTVVHVAYLSVVVGTWTALAVKTRPRSQAFAIGLVAMAGPGAAICIVAIHRPHLGRGMAFLFFAILGLTLAHLADQPSWRRARIFLDRATILLGSAVLTVATTGFLRLLLIGMVFGVVGGWYAAAITEGEAWSASLTRWLPAWRTMAMLLAVALALMGTVAWAGDREEDGIRRAVQLEAGLPIKRRPFDFFPLEAPKVVIVAPTDDPLHVCQPGRVARLLGRNGDTAYVLLRPRRRGDPTKAFVLPLPTSKYTVVYGLDDPDVCASLPP